MCDLRPLDNAPPRSLRVCAHHRSWRRRTAHHCCSVRRWCGVARPARDEHQLAAKVQAGAPRRACPSRRAPHAHCKAGPLCSAHPCCAPQVFIGDQSVGKTSIISRFMYDQFDTHYASTIGACTAQCVASGAGVRRAGGRPVAGWWWQAGGQADGRSGSGKVPAQPASQPAATRLCCTNRY